MNTSSLKRGDVVEVDKKGRRFFALVGERSGAAGDIVIKPFDNRVSYRRCTAREVIGIWHANKATAERKGYGRVAADA